MRTFNIQDITFTPIEEGKLQAGHNACPLSNFYIAMTYFQLINLQTERQKRKNKNKNKRF